MNNEKNTTTIIKHARLIKRMKWANSDSFTFLRCVFLFFGAFVILACSYLVLCFLSDQESAFNPIKANLENLATASATIGALVATIWAIQTYWRLRYIDEQMGKWQSKENESEIEYKQEDEDKVEVEYKWLDPFTFHALAESHKEWAQLWFAWCIAITMWGVTYAIYNFNIAIHSADNLSKGCTPEGTKCLISGWQYAYTLISTQAPNGFIYLLFGVVWYWASKHYRSHWHNFVINAYRHRALWRFQGLQKNIRKAMNKQGISSNFKENAEQTILELYRLSGILLLIPGDSSYLEKVGGDELSKAILQMEEIAKAFTGPQTKSQQP
jgi:hypothetical protein